MSQGPPTGESSEPEAKVLHTKRLYRAVVEAVHRLDLILCNKTAYQEVFKPENISLRNKLRELCVKLMFLHPVDYGRKAEELLWRKVYYEVIQLIKTNKKHIHSRSTLECAYRTHLVAGIGFYQHLLLYIQSHYQLELQCCIDWTHVTDPLIGCKKPVSASGKEMDWAQMACHRCLVYLGDLSRYQNELAGVDTELLAERFYYQALSVAPQIGMPFNQLGTLAGSKYYNVEAMYCYLRWGTLTQPCCFSHNRWSSSEEGSESEGSESSGRSCRNERSIQEKLQVLMAEGLLPAVKVFLDWLRTNPDLIIVCAQSSQSLWNRLSVLLNLLPAAGELQESGLALCPEVQDLLEGCELPDLPSSLLLPEDMALRNLPPLRAAHRRFNFDTDRPLLSTLEESVVRICCIRSFGHFIARLQGSILQFNPEVGIFVSIAQSEQESLLQQAQAQFRMAQEEARRNRLMRDMAQLRLQLEVSQLEGSLQQPKAQSAMSPYLVPDTQALCHHLPVIRQLATSGRFIVIIPRTVIDGLDLLKKEHPGARDGIRYLEAEFKKGNRYIRCQKEVGKSFERHKLKRQDADAWTLYKILDSCKQLTLAQGAGEEDPSGMVTIITGLPLDNPSVLSGPMQAALQAAAHASVDIKNVLDFYKQWKEIG
ncbi:protein SMG5 [Theropithecus gelada]|uniref:protein SMG5 n=1 Tax=Theropithecus gelada TaxID=9565 RepID=UPI000DC1B1CD|nr:protein SMG5 [Theropithecus gelada]